MLNMLQCRGVVAKLPDIYTISYSTNSTNGAIMKSMVPAPKPPTWLGYDRTPKKPVRSVSFKARPSNAWALIRDFVDQDMPMLADRLWYRIYVSVVAVAVLLWGFRWFYRRRRKASLERQAMWNEWNKIHALPLHLSRNLFRA